MIQGSASFVNGRSCLRLRAPTPRAPFRDRRHPGRSLRSGAARRSGRVQALLPETPAPGGGDARGGEGVDLRRRLVAPARWATLTRSPLSPLLTASSGRRLSRLCESRPLGPRKRQASTEPSRRPPSRTHPLGTQHDRSRRPFARPRQLPPRRTPPRRSRCRDETAPAPHAACAAQRAPPSLCHGLAWPAHRVVVASVDPAPATTRRLPTLAGREVDVRLDPYARSHRDFVVDDTAANRARAAPDPRAPSPRICWSPTTRPPPMRAPS